MIVDYKELSISTDNKMKAHAQSFIKRAYKCYDLNKYDLSGATYRGATKKLKIRCITHGVFYQLPNNFLRYGCSKCKLQENFLARVKNEVVDYHRFDYTSMVFIKYREPIKIKCNIHGPISITPELHLKCGCKECYKLESFLQRANKKYFGKNYDYSKVKLIKQKEFITIICPTHQEFYQKPEVHLNKNCKGCPDCSYEIMADRNRTTKEDFLKKANKKHKNKYDYDLDAFTGLRSKITIRCKDHGTFSQLANNHLLGRGCKDCSNIEMSKSKMMSHDQWIKRAIKRHGNRFDYSKVIYNGRKKTISIRCKKHDLTFSQNPHNHLYKSHSCEKCVKEVIRSDTEEFIGKATKVHGTKYNYSEIEYIDSFTKVKVLCKNHGAFYPTPANHLFGTGCPGCRESHGEAIIKKYLSENSVVFEYNKRFDKLKVKRDLLFDFYIKKNKLLIEYDGEQHFRPIKYFGGAKEFKLLKIRDEMKNNYAIQNKIKLVRINYKEIRRIPEILDNIFKPLGNES